MVYRARYQLGKSYCVLDGEAIIMLEAGKKLDREFLKDHSSPMRFTQSSILIVKFGSEWVQYCVLTSEGMSEMTFFGTKSSEKKQFEDISIWRDQEQLYEFAKAGFANCRDQRLLDFDENEGKEYNIARPLTRDENSIEVGYWVKEEIGKSTRVRKIKMSQRIWDRCVQEFDSSCVKFEVFSKYFLGR